MKNQLSLKNGVYKSLYQHAPMGFAYHQIILNEHSQPVDYRFVEVNEAFEKLTGLKAADIVGKTVKEVIPGIADGTFDWIGTYGELAINGGSASFERYLEPFKKWYNIQAYSIEKYFFATSFIEVTEQKNSELGFQTLSDASFEALFVSENGICKDQNKTAEKQFGYSRQEALGKPGTDWIVPHDRNLVLKNMLSGFEAPYEVMAQRKNGDTFPAEVQAKMIHLNGRNIRITALRDITQRKKAEEAIENEKKLHQIIDNIDHVVWLRSADRQEVLYVSQSYSKVFGRSPQSLCNNPASFTEAIHPEDINRIQLAYENFIRTGHFKEEYRIIRPDGEIRWISSQSFPVKDNTGKTIRYAGIAKDITNAKELDYTVLKIRSIRNQLDPHFTFNAFNAIASTFLKESDKISYKYFTRFSKLLRGSMIYSDQISRPLKDEVECTTHYLEIEKFRFRDKFDYVINIEDGVDNTVLVPRMIIQAYAETAIANGLMHRTENGMLAIDVSQQQGFIKIRIADNGVGLKKSSEYNKDMPFVSSSLMEAFIAVINSMSAAKIEVNINDVQKNGKIEGTQVDISLPPDVNYEKLTNYISL
jgi:PAS domain S-box-containing protein